MKCLNCSREMSPDEGKLFAQVLVCPECYTLAVRTTERIESELRACLALVRDQIRVKLIQGELRAPPQVETPPMSKADLLRAMAERYSAGHASTREPND
jgi:hypothetical protein